jgi:hypothetical protein
MTASLGWSFEESVGNNLFSTLFHPCTCVFLYFKSYMCTENVFRSKFKYAECDFTFIYLFNVAVNSSDCIA